jgi:RimJ/RimL family protein N-acetyltransferase
MVKLQLIQFTAAHFDILEKEIKDTKALMQWAGPKYSYPLSWDQMKNKIDEQDENGQKNFLFSAEILNSSEFIGHVQLSILDRTAKTGNIGSVLVFSKFRNMGLGKEIVKEIMKLGFYDKNLNELRLGVFDFNSPAIRCYRKIGFKDYDFEKNAREIENESWNLVRMKITKEEFLKHVERGPSMARI